MKESRRLFGFARPTRLLAVFVTYQIVALLFFGRTLLFHFGDFHAGSGPDPQFMLWSIAWWPYALSHHLNPLFCRLVWAPDGFDVVWSTSIALQSVMAAPVTLYLGPVVSLNLWALTAPALSALAGFLLGKYLVGKTGSAFLCGYLYGFSPFMVGQQAGAHIVLTSAFLVPVIILITQRRIEGHIGRVAFVVGLALVLVCQFLMGLELFATSVLFGTAALGVAWLIWPEWRARLQAAAALIAVALTLTTIVLAPMLLHVLTGSGMGRHRVWENHGVDLFELIVPDHFFLLGALLDRDGSAVAYAHFSRDVGGYVGLPLLLLGILFCYARWSDRRVRLLAVMLAITYVAALGPALHWRGIELCGMPWKIFAKVPLINSAQSARFALFVHLLLAVIASMWLADTSLGRPKLLIAGLIVVALLPDLLDESLWAGDLATPEFFTTHDVRDSLKPGETTLLLPYSANGQGMTWQALSEMYFAMAGGWTGPTPAAFAAWPILETFDLGVSIPEENLQLLAFMAAHRATAMIIDEHDLHTSQWVALLDSQTTQIKKIGGVILARPSAAALTPYLNVTAEQMQCRRDDRRFRTLLVAAHEYLQRAYPLKQLTPLAVQERQLLPPNWVTAQDNAMISGTGLELGPSPNDGVIIGVSTPASCAETLADRYHPYVEQIFFPYPHQMGTKTVPQGSQQAQLVMVFTRPALAQAATAASAAESR